MSNTYRRVLLKLSGETLMGDQQHGLSSEGVEAVVEKVVELTESGIEVALVFGGGNFFRGLQGGPSLELERCAADQVGMLATLMNGVVMQQAFTRRSIPTTVMSAIECPAVADRFHFEKANELLSNKHLLIFAGGTGHPFFTTDTAAALRASEIKADLLLKVTSHVDGIYDKDPRVDKSAKLYSELSYKKYLAEKLGILDLTAVTLCMTNKIPVRVCNFTKAHLVEACSKESAVGTIVRGDT